MEVVLKQVHKSTSFTPHHTFFTHLDITKEAKIAKLFPKDQKTLGPVGSDVHRYTKSI